MEGIEILALETTKKRLWLLLVEYRLRIEY